MKSALLFAILITPVSVHAQSSIQPTFKLSTAGTCRPLTVDDPNKPGTDKSVPLGCLTTSNTFEPVLNDTVVVPDKPVSLNSYAPTGNDFAGRVFPARSIGTHPDIARYGAFTEMVADGSGVASGPKSADYGLGISISKKDWFTKDEPGEMDALTLFCRQSIGDCAGILSNVAARSGFAATLESYTGDLIAGTGEASKAVGLQMGVINSRDGGEDGSLGYLAIAKTGNLGTAFRAQNDTGAAWGKSYMAARDGVENFYVAGATGAVVSSGTGTFGFHAAGDAVLDLGSQRTADGSSRLDFNTALAGGPNARLFRSPGTNGTFIVQQNGSGAMVLTAPNSTVNLAAGNVISVTAGAAGVGFNGATPIGKQTLSPAFANPASASNEQLAVAYNSLRATLVTVGLGQ